MGQAKPVRAAQLPAAFAAYHHQAQRQDPGQADKLFVAVLLLLKHHPIAVLGEALEKALAQNLVSIEVIQNYAEELTRHKNPVKHPVQEPVQASSSSTVAPPAINRYCQLHEGEVSA